MRLSKLVSFLTAIAVSASAFAVLPAAVSAADEDAYLAVAEDDVTPGEGEEPKLPDPIEELDGLKELEMGQLVTFGTAGTYKTPTLISDDYVAVYPGIYEDKDRDISVDTSGKKVDGVEYPGRLKFGGTVIFDVDGAPAIRTISVKPSVDGVLAIVYTNASGSGGPRPLGVYQNGAEIGAKPVSGGENLTFYISVKAGSPVYIYSKDSGINIYGIKLTDTAPEETNPPTETDPPEDLDIKPLPAGETITFDVINAYEATAQYGDYVAIYAASGKKIETASSKKTINGTDYTSCLKLGGSGSVKDGTPSRAIAVIPAVSGTLAIDFIHASSDGVRTLAAYQNGAEIGTRDVDGSESATLTVAVAAGEPVYIYSKSSGINIYGITLTAGGDTPTEPTEPTPSEPVQAEKCVKITVTYKADGSLGKVETEEVDKSTATGAVRTETSLVTYWDSLDNMKPVTADSEEPTAPVPTKEPEEDWDWAASEADFGSPAGTVLIPGLTQLFDNTSTNKSYITGTVNGEYDEETSDKPTMLKFEPTQDGVLKVKVTGLGANKSVMILEAGTKADASEIKNEGADKIDVTLSREVEAGKTYYVTGKGTKACFAAAKFTAQAVAKSYNWAASEADFGSPAGTVLFEGLTQLFDNTSTNKAYITGTVNGEYDEETSDKPTMLKFEPTQNGVLTVTIKDLDNTKTAVIIEKGTKEDASAVTPDSKQDVTVTREVEAGKTYYVTVKGSKARFAAANFTTAK